MTRARDLFILALLIYAGAAALWLVRRDPDGARRPARRRVKP